MIRGDREGLGLECFEPVLNRRRHFQAVRIHDMIVITRPNLVLRRNRFSCDGLVARDSAWMTEASLMDKPVDQFAHLFDPIEDLPGVVYEELQWRSSEWTRCLRRRGLRSQRGRLELCFDRLCLPSDLIRMEGLAAPAAYAVLVISILIVLVAPPGLRILVFAWLVCGPSAVAAVAKQVLLWRASLAGESLSVLVTRDSLAVKLGSEIASLGAAPFRGVLVREFRAPRRTKYAVHLATRTNCIVPVSGWMDRDAAFELGQSLSRTLGLRLTAEYSERQDMGCFGSCFTPYRPFAPSNGNARQDERFSLRPEGTGLVTGESGAGR